MTNMLIIIFISHLILFHKMHYIWAVWHRYTGLFIWTIRHIVYSQGRHLAEGGGRDEGCEPIYSSQIKIRLHNENQIPLLPASKVSAKKSCWWVVIGSLSIIVSLPTCVEIGLGWHKCSFHMIWIIRLTLTYNF